MTQAARLKALALSAVPAQQIQAFIDSLVWANLASANSVALRGEVDDFFFVIRAFAIEVLHQRRLTSQPTARPVRIGAVSRPV